MSQKKKKSLFWASYADLMTSLFFVMLILFSGSIITLNKERNEFRGKYETSEREKKVLQEINDATKNIDPKYFEYIDKYKKHRLKIDVNFQMNDDNIFNLSETTRSDLLSAGKTLRDFVDKTVLKNPEIQYLLIIEGQASRYGPMDFNYRLSYSRAYGLKKFWEDNGIRFTAENCEVLICGSGDGQQSGTGLMKETNEEQNQRFLIYILPKPGQVTNYENK